MIYVDGLPFPADNLASPSSSSLQESGLLVGLLEHPVLVSAAGSVKSVSEQKVSFNKTGSERLTKPRYVFVFQREYAIVDPAIVDFVGTDEATTCVGLVLRNRKSGMTSIAHMDSPDVVDSGLTQMLSLLFKDEFDKELDVHLLGGFEDFSTKSTTGSKGHQKADGYSFPLCTKIVETLLKRPENFHIQTLFVLGHNTKLDSQGNSCPIFNGFLFETSTGSIIPASFDRTSRCPDEIVRRIRLSAAYEDPSWEGKLLETYDTLTDRFVIAPCCWTFRLIEIVSSLQQLSDEEILGNYSTSPFAEGPDFVDNERRMCDYLIKNPVWKKTFPMKQPRVFERTAKGDWKRC